MGKGYAQAWGEGRGDTLRPLRSLPPPRPPSQSHTHLTLSMALLLVPRQGPACLLLLSLVWNWDPGSTRPAGRQDLQGGCHPHSDP